jgi:uncharacterized protein
MKKEREIVSLIAGCLMALFILVMTSAVSAGDIANLPKNAGPAWPSLIEAQGYPLPRTAIAPCDFGIVVEKNLPVPMRDGVITRANVYRPDKPGKYPVIMSITSFHKDIPGWWGKQAFVQPWQISAETAWEAADPGFWVPYGYAVILVDQRGYGMSAGCRLGLQEGEDFYDAVEWAAAQPWCDGNVGMSGVSGLANVQYYTAQQRPPHLKAIAVWEGSAADPTEKFGGIPETYTQSRIRQRDAVLEPAFGQCMPAKRPPSKLDTAKINVPALMCGDWMDAELHLRGTVYAWKTISSEHKWLYTHGREKWKEYYSEEAKTFQKMFFDHFLKDTDTRILDTPRVRLEVRETITKYHVRYEDDWPIPRTQYKKLYLDGPNGALSFRKVDRPGTVDYNSGDGVYHYPLKQNEQATFEITFDEDTELTGVMRLKLWVSSKETTDMDIFATIRKLDANGNIVNFDSWYNPGRFPAGLGWLRLSWREVDEQKTTPWYLWYKFQTQQKVAPGEIVPCLIEIYPASTLWRKGEKLRLTLSGISTIDRDPLTGWRYEEHSINKGVHSIYTGGERESYLQIPVVPPKPSAKK